MSTIGLAPRIPGAWIIMDGLGRGQPVPAFYRYLSTLTNQVNTTTAGTPSAQLTASEALSVGSLVNITTNWQVRKADASIAGREAHGFVASAVASGQTALVFFAGIIPNLSGLSPGYVYLSTSGALTNTAPTTAGYTVQRVGVSISATQVAFMPEMSTLLQVNG